MKKIILRNIVPLWRVYWILAAVTLAAFLVLSKLAYSQSEEKEFQGLKHLNEIVKKGVESRLYSQESLLKILSSHLLELDAINNPNNAQRLMDSLMKNSPNLAGFGLALPDGQLIMVSNNTSTLPNILDNEHVKTTFAQTLKNEHMVVGHTYYLDLLKKWVLPLRYALKNSSGAVEMVIIVWYDIENLGNSLFSHKNISKNTTAAVVSGDYYMLDYKISYERNTAYYTTPLPNTVVEQFNLKSLKVDGDLIHKKYIDRFNKDRYIAVSYISEYDIFISLTRSTADAFKDFLPNALFLLAVTLLFMLILYLFFRYISIKDKKSKKKLEYRANHDDLTGLVNRFTIAQKIEYNIGKKNEFSLAFIDIDSFKKINDFHGHDMGDKVLIKIAKKMKFVLERDMVLSRFSGDEFSLLIPGERSRAVNICKNILDTLNQAIEFEYNSIRLTASIGLACYPDDAKTLKTLMSYTDLALQKAKTKRNTLEFFDEQFHKKVQRKSAIEELFNTALENEEFYLNYQPQVDSKTHKIVGMEALVRWESKELGTVFPDEFIHIAEESGFIIPLGLYVLERACKETQELWAASSTNFRLSVNVSVRQLMENDFIRKVNEIINQIQFPHNMLIIEVTESLMIEDMDMIIQKLQLLRDLGIGVSLDDFGTGFSSLSMVNKLPISELKVDQSFVRDILTDKEDALLTEMVVTIGKHLNVEIVAEGVEEMEHIEILKEYGCNTLQGYYFSRPTSPQKILEFIHGQ